MIAEKISPADIAAQDIDGPMARDLHQLEDARAHLGASNFFELVVATAITLFGFQSSAALSTVVGVLVEVPVMLSAVQIVRRSRGWYERGTAGARPILRTTERRDGPVILLNLVCLRASVINGWKALQPAAALLRMGQRGRIAA